MIWQILEGLWFVIVTVVGAIIFLPLVYTFGTKQFLKEWVEGVISDLIDAYDLKRNY